MSTSVALLLAVGLALGPGEDIEPGPGQVSVELSRWEALRAMVEDRGPVDEGPGPWARDRQVRIERAAAGIRVRVTWALEAVEAGWLAAPLVGPVDGMRVESATWRGRELGIAHTSSGEEVALEMAARSRGELELVVFVPAGRLPGGVDGNFDLWLMPAVQGEVSLDGAAGPEGRVPELVAEGQGRRAIDGRFWAGEGQLTLTWVDAAREDAGVQGPLAVARSGVGLTFGDGEVRGRAHVSWLLRRGRLDRVSVDTKGLGTDLEVSGPNVHAWTRSGERIEIELKDAAEGRVDVDLRWTQGLPSGDEAELAAPRIVPGQAYRSESYMQIARDGELEVLPKLSGWSPVARAELPDWAGGYIRGTATASFRRDGEDRGASFDLLRFVPVSGPPVVVDTASYEIATTDEGRSLVQARYDVRNERASHLRVELPAGARLIGVRVNGETVTPARDTSPTTSQTTSWRVPLVRSLESVKGALSFPVELVFIGEADPWTRKEQRELALPALDAPVAVSRVRVYLPPRYANRLDLGDHHRVGAFSEGEGITYGLGASADLGQVAQADRVYREAVSAWMENDFRKAQSSLDELGTLGASNANIEGLQANLDLVQGRAEHEGDAGQSAVVARRIKDQARRRSTDDQLELLEKAKQAEALEAQGQYGEAEKTLAEAQEIGDRLALLEQRESKEQAVYNEVLSSKSKRVADKKQRKAKREDRAKKGKRAKNQRQLPAQTKTPARDDAAEELANFGPITGEVAAPPPEEPEARPEPEPEPEPVATSTVTLEDMERLPVVAGTSRDFTAVVDIAPGVSADRKRSPSKPKPSLSKQPQAPEDPNAALAAPVAVASAVSVHIPAIGEAVLYQHMLLPEGQALTVHLEARRQRAKTSKSK